MDRSQLLKEFGFNEEECEVIKGEYGKTGFPEPKKSYHLYWEIYDLSLEEPYYWILHQLKEYFQYVEKLEDSFAASENSAFFGVTQQRLGAQQDKISQFLATTGKMIKELFQMVRELRIIDERLDYYQEVEQQCHKLVEQRSKSAEITLKGLFVDLVQGGGKSAASVYGMARELEFITLTDLFFNAPPFKDGAEIDQHIQSLEKNFNLNVTRVLQRHLRQYMEWRKRTHQEHGNRRRFQLAYLLQHFEIIKMYVNWVKPYLRHVSKLTMKGKNMSSADLVSAFEGSMLDIELLGRKTNGQAHGCLLVTFNYRTRPELKVVQEGYQRGPVHIGKFEMTLRVYGWNDQQLENYRKLKEKETILLMGDVSSSVEQAMESLGKELDHYLEEARGAKKQVESPAAASASPSLAERFFGDFYSSKSKKASGPSARSLKKEAQETEEALEKVVSSANLTGFNIYKNFKKAHRMVMW